MHIATDNDRLLVEGGQEGSGVGQTCVITWTKSTTPLEDQKRVQCDENVRGTEEWQVFLDMIYGYTVNKILLSQPSKDRVCLFQFHLPEDPCRHKKLLRQKPPVF